MKTRTSLISFASRFFVFPLLAAFAAAVVLVAAMAGPAHALVLDGTPQTISGTPSGTITPGINGSYFDNITNYANLNLDGANYTIPTDRCLAGTQGLLGLTPTVNAPLYTGEIRGFGMFTGVGGDKFSTGFSGTFTPQDSGTHWFEWHNDDRGAMYIDLNNDGIFQSSDRVGTVDWHVNASVDLTALTPYNFIYMTADGGGGYNNDWYMRTPTLTSNVRPNAGATAQAGMWNVGTITYGPLDFSTEDLVVNATTTLTLNSSSNVPFRLLLANDGTATINGTVPSLSFTGTTVAAAATSGIATSASVTLGPVAIGAGSTLIANGTGTKTATSIALSGATGGITAGGTFNMGTYADGGNVKTLTLGGTGTKVMDNSAGGISAAKTTLRITGGTLDTTPTAVGANDPLGGATAIQLAGGTLKMQGQTTINSNALKATLYNSLPNGAWRPYIEFWSGGYDLRYQTPVATATETGAIWYRSNGSDGTKKWSDLFSGQPDEGLFYVMWKGQYKPSVSSNKVIGSWEADNDYDAFVKINGNWERWRDWRNLDSANWYDMAITYANWDGYGSIRLPMHQSYQDWTLLDVSSGNSFGQFRFSTVGSLDMSARTVQLDASSEIAMTTDFAVSFGALTVNNGVLTLSGAPSTSFAGTTVNAAATQIGFNSAGTVDAGAIAGNSATATFVKAGAGTLTLNAGNTGLGNMQFDVQGGSLIAVASGSLGGSTSVKLSGGSLQLSSTGGTTAYDIGLDVTQNSTLKAGKATGGDTGQTVNLGSDSKLLTVRNGKILTVNATDSYVLNINDSVTLEDNATMDFNAANGKINNNGAASLSMGGNSTLNLNAGALTTDKALSVYNLNLNGGGLVQTGFGSAKDLYVGGTLKVDSASTNLDLTGATLTTASNATINLVNGQLTTEKALNVGNLTVESGATLNMTGTGADRNIVVGDRLRLANKTWNTTGSALSVGNRIELQSSSLTTGNALTVNSLWMNDNSTINPATSLTVNGQIELYNGSNADFTGKTLSVGGIRMENNATLTYDKPMTVNGQIEIYNNSKVDLGSNVLTTNWQNLYVRGGTSELKAAGNLNINYLEIWDGGGTLSVPSVTLNDGAQIRSTDSRYGNNVHNFSIAENPGNPGRWMNVYGGGVDRNPNDGSSDLYFNGTNTYTGRTQIMDATVLVANDGVGMPAGSTVRFENGVWGASGAITRTIGEDNTGGGKVFWGNWGGFAAYGGDLAVTLTTDEGAGAQLYWNSNTRGFNNQGLYLGSSNATNNVTLTNNIEINSYAQIRTESRTKLATLSGNLTGGETLDKQGPGTLVLTGDNSGFSGRNYIRRGVLDVGNLSTGKGLGTGRIDLQADTDDPYWKGAILQANGTLAKTIGNDPGNIRWEDNGGGFAARGGSLTVTLNSDATINWNDDPSGFRGRRLMFGSGTADDVVTLTNNIDAQNGYRYIYAFDNPNSAADKAVLSGNLMNLSGFEKRGDGVLETKGNAGLLSTSGDNVRIYDGGTLKVNGDLRAGDPYTDTDPRYIGSSDRNVENYDGKLVVTGNVQASWYYGGGSANSSNDIAGNLTIRSHYEQNEGTAHIGGNLQTGENWVGVRNSTVLTVDGDLRAGAPSGSSADREVYSWGGARLNVGGDLKASRLYFEQGKAANGQLPGITVGGTANINGEVDLRTGPSTFNNLTANDVNVRYGADLTVNGNLTTNSLNASEWDYWNYAGGRASSIHLNGPTAVINGGDGNININANNPSSGYGVLDGSATVSANRVDLQNKAMLAGTLTLNVKDGVYIDGSSILSPGNSVGTLTIVGALTLAGDALFEINGTGFGEYDRVIGVTDLTYGGTLTIETASLMGKFDLHLFDFTSQSGSFTAITDAGGHYTTGQLSMNYETGELSGVPEPATMVLMGLGGLGLILSRKRR